MNKYPAITGLALSLALGLGLVPAPLHADDFAFFEVGARAAALGGAFTAKADDISAIFYNPAGLAFLKGVRFKTNLVMSQRAISAYSATYDRTFTSTPGSFLANIFLSWQPAKRIGLGLGYFSPYNFRSLWQDPLWIGGKISLGSKLNTQVLRSVLSVEIVKGLALGAALDFTSMSVEWSHQVPFEIANYTLPADTKVDCRHSLRGHGLGFTASALWRVFPALRVGARYQKSVTIDLAGGNGFGIPRDFSGGTVPDPYWPYRQVWSLLDFFFVPQEVTGQLTLPREIACGVVVSPASWLSLHLDAQWDKWSEFGRWEFRSVNADGDLNPAFTSDYREFWGVTPNYGTMGAAFDAPGRALAQGRAGGPVGPVVHVEGRLRPQREHRRTGRQKPCLPGPRPQRLFLRRRIRRPRLFDLRHRGGRRPAVARSLRPLQRGRAVALDAPRNGANVRLQALGGRRWRRVHLLGHFKRTVSPPAEGRRTGG